MAPTAVMEKEPKIREKESKSESLEDLAAMHKKREPSRAKSAGPEEQKKGGHAKTALYIAAIVATGAAAYSLVRKVDDPDWKEDIRKVKQPKGGEDRDGESKEGDGKETVRRVKTKDRETEDKEEDEPEEEIEEKRRRPGRGVLIAGGAAAAAAGVGGAYVANRYSRSISSNSSSDRSLSSGPSRRESYWDNDRDRERSSSRFSDYTDYNSNGRYETSMPSYQEQPSVAFDDRVRYYYYQDSPYRDDYRDDYRGDYRDAYLDNRYRQDAYDDDRSRRDPYYYNREADRDYYTRTSYPARDYR